MYIYVYYLPATPFMYIIYFLIHNTCTTSILCIIYHHSFCLELETHHHRVILHTDVRVYLRIYNMTVPPHIQPQRITMMPNSHQNGKTINTRCINYIMYHLVFFVSLRFIHHCHYTFHVSYCLRSCCSSRSHDASPCCQQCQPCCDSTPAQRHFLYLPWP